MTPDELRVVILVVHAAAGVVALAAGCVALMGRGGAWTHLVAVVVMTGTLVPSLYLGWSGFAAATRVVFLGLLVLSIVMCVIAVSVVRGAEHPRRLSPELADRLGFNVISLVVAGTIVPIINVSGNAVVVAVVALVALLAARAFVQWRVRVTRAAAGAGLEQPLRTVGGGA